MVKPDVLQLVGTNLSGVFYQKSPVLVEHTFRRIFTTQLLEVVRNSSMAVVKEMPTDSALKSGVNESAWKTDVRHRYGGR